MIESMRPPTPRRPPGLRRLAPSDLGLLGIEYSILGMLAAGILGIEQSRGHRAPPARPIRPPGTHY